MMRFVLLLLVAVTSLHAQRIDLDSGDIYFDGQSVEYNEGALPIESAGVYQFSSHFEIDTTIETPVLFLGAMYYPCVVSVNGYEIYRWGTLDSAGGMCNYGANTIQIPKQILNQFNCFTIDFWTDGLTMGLAERWIGTQNEVSRKTEFRNAINQTGIRVGVIVSFIVALISFVAYFVTPQKQKLILYLSFSLMVTALAFNGFLFNAQSIDHLTQSYIFRSATILMVYALFGLITEITGFLNSTRLRVIHFVLLIPLFVTIWSCGSKYEIESLMAMVASFYITPILLIMIFLIIRAIYLKKGRIFWFIFCNYLVLFYASYNDLSSLKAQVLPEYWLIPYGYLFITISILAYMISVQINMYTENTNMSRELQSLNELLCKGNDDLISSKNAIQKESEMRESFIRTVAHELRTPLTGLVGGVDTILNDSAMPVKLKQPLFYIKSSFHRLLITVSNLFDYVEMTQGEIQIIPHRFVVADVITPVLEYYRQSALSKGISLIVLPSPDVPKELFGDSEHLVQIIDNLIENAVKFTDNGGVSYEMSFASDLFTVEIKDTGKGIDEELKKAMFDAFYRGERYSYSQQYEGVGLGLAIVDNVVKAMKGTLSFSSTEERGSTFTISVPMMRDHSKRYNFTTNRRVLVVEDNIVNSLMVCKQLESGSFFVESVVNGQEAVAICKEKLFDAILMDVQMPVMDGLTATREIRKFNHKIPIIALTANGNPRECHNAGINALLTKPTSVEKLLALVSEQIINAENDNESTI